MPTTPAPIAFRHPFEHVNPLNQLHSGNVFTAPVITPPVGQPEITDGIAFVQNKYSQAPKQNIVSKGIKKVSSCDVLECTFESDFCRYSQPEINANEVR